VCTQTQMDSSLPPRCKDLLSEYNFMIDSYLCLRQKGETPIDLMKAIKRMRKEYLMKCPIPETGLPKLV
jgi:hypothetical protein